MPLRVGLVVAFSAIAIPLSAAADERCGEEPPAVRKGGGLTVETPPRPPPQPPGGSRLRSDAWGSLWGRADKERVWVGIEVPAFVPLTIDTLELQLLDRDGDRFMAFYRDPYDKSSCPLATGENCLYRVRIYTCAGDQLIDLRLNDFTTKSSGLEVQDVRFADNVLYFNLACQSYSREQKGKCSSLVAVDAATGRLLWRTRHLVSNNVFLVVNSKYLVTGYGFTAEPSALFLVRRRDGKVVAKQAIKRVVYPGGNHDHLALVGGDMLEVGLYEHPDNLLVSLIGITGDRPRFELTRGVKAIPTSRP
jgi:hypothetical protein